MCGLEREDEKKGIVGLVSHLGSCLQTFLSAKKGNEGRDVAVRKDRELQVWGGCWREVRLRARRQPLWDLREPGKS